MVKGTHPTLPRDESIPVILFDYDVNIEIQDGTGRESEIEVGAAAKFLRVIGLSTKARLQGDSRHNETEVQRLKFTIPVAMPLRTESAKPPRNSKTMRQYADEAKRKDAQVS
jgi:hypothetical protein